MTGTHVFGKEVEGVVLLKPIGHIAITLESVGLHSTPEYGGGNSTFPLLLGRATPAIVAKPEGQVSAAPTLGKRYIVFFC